MRWFPVLLGLIAGSLSLSGCLPPYELPSDSPRLKVVRDWSSPARTAYMRGNLVEHEDVWGTGLERIVRPDRPATDLARSFRKNQTTRTVLYGAGGVGIGLGVGLGMMTSMVYQGTYGNAGRNGELVPVMRAAGASLASGCLLSAVGLGFDVRAHSLRLRAIETFNANQGTKDDSPSRVRPATPASPSGTARP